MVWDKEAITPLMITFLLISFAVAVGIVVMNLGRAEVQEEAECPVNIGLHFAVIGGEEQVCYDQATGKLKFTVENGVNIKVEGVVVNVIGEEKAETYEIDDAKMPRAGSYLGQVNYDALVGGAIRQVKISPKVMLYDQEQVCMDKALLKEEIEDC